MDPPRFEHDCQNCIFLGGYEEYDLYFCPQGGLPTIIARTSSEGGDYFTIYPPKEWRKSLHGMQEALFAAGQRAIALGLTTEEELVR